MYQTDLKTADFLQITYRLMINKINRVKEIDLHSKRNKLPLPLLKEKYEIVGNLLKVITELINNLDYSQSGVNALADGLNEIGYSISKGNFGKISDSIEWYNRAEVLISSFLNSEL